MVGVGRRRSGHPSARSRGRTDPRRAPRLRCCVSPRRCRGRRGRARRAAAGPAGCTPQPVGRRGGHADDGAAGRTGSPLGRVRVGSRPRRPICDRPVARICKDRSSLVQALRRRLAPSTRAFPGGIMTELAIDDSANGSSRSLTVRHPIGAPLVGGTVEPSSPTPTDDDSTGAHRPRPHTLVQSVVLHLAPGAAVLAAYAALVPVARHFHLPSAAALAATGLVAVAPVQLGLLRRHRRRHPGEAAVQLRRRLPLPRVLAWALLEIVLAAVAFLLTAPLVDRLQGAFGWWPSAWALDLGNHDGYTRGAQLATALLLLLGTVLVAPLVEELYFRGYLLPRMPPRLGAGTPLAHATLFALYHLQTPWLTPARIVAITPLAYIATRTRDVRIGMVAHCVLNAVDLVVLILFISR